MKVRIVIPRTPAQAAKLNPDSPLTSEVRAVLAGPIPPAYLELRPDKQGGLKVVWPEPEKP